MTHIHVVSLLITLISLRNKWSRHMTQFVRNSAFGPLSSYHDEIDTMMIKSFINSCVVIFSRDTCVVFRPFFAKVGTTANESIHELNKR